MIGRVVSTKMTNTVVVEVERLVQHPVYKKRLLRTSRFLVDDQLGVKEGDRVRLASVRPISGKKHHKIVEILTDKEKGRRKNGSES